jgi:hypothetical protein
VKRSGTEDFTDRMQGDSLNFDQEAVAGGEESAEEQDTRKNNMRFHKSITQKRLTLHKSAKDAIIQELSAAESQSTTGKISESTLKRVR